jgi:nucleotide-binding universal stress UspA family protein
MDRLTMSFQHTSIVIAIDDAGSAGRALDYGLEMAEALRLPVRIVHAARLPDSHAADVRLIDRKDIEQSASTIPEYELAAELLDRAMARAGERQIEIEPVLLGGEPADALLRYLKDCDRPMLFVGRRGQGRIAELLLGSVSDKLIRHAQCPVFVIS